MAFEFEIDTTEGIMCKRGTGSVTVDDIHAQLAAEMEHPDFKPGLRRLVDYRFLEPRLSAEDVEAIAATMGRLQDRFGSARWAIVTNSDLVYGLTRMYMAFSDDSPIEVSVFREMDAARDWLGLPEGYCCPLVRRGAA